MQVSDFFLLNRAHGWRLSNRFFCNRITGSLRKWLLYSNSMTVCLQQACAQTMTVEVLAQGWARTHRAESRLLELPIRQYAYVREVALHGNKEPWMLARTVIPISSLRGKARCLQFELNERPLGELLFRDYTLRRSPFELNAMNEMTWARRSIFTFKGYPILLTEIFLPSLIAHCSRYEPLATPD